MECKINHSIKLPKITVVTVVHNGKNSLEETIRSISSLSYPNIEYIIIDGGSTDGTLEIIERYKSYIKLWISESDRGIYDAMNKGILYSKGEFIWFINSGDIALNLDEFYLDMKKECEAYAYCYPVIKKYDNHEELSTRRITNPHQGIIYRRIVFDIIGLYEDYKLISDRVFFDEIRRQGLKLYYGTHPVATYDMYGISASPNSKKLTRHEFKLNLIKKRDLISLYRYFRSML